MLIRGHVTLKQRQRNMNVVSTDELFYSWLPHLVLDGMGQGLKSKNVRHVTLHVAVNLASFAVGQLA